MLIPACRMEGTEPTRVDSGPLLIIGHVCKGAEECNVLKCKFWVGTLALPLLSLG